MVSFCPRAVFLTESLLDVFATGMGMMAGGGGGSGRGGGYGMQGHFNPAFMQGQGGQYPQAKRFRNDDGS